MVRDEEGSLSPEDPDHLLPGRVAQFMYRASNEELQADVAGFVRELLRKCETA